MGFYVRKSISVGPFRFNLSGSGVGVSAGVKGLRFGIGPRGNYVHMGRGGLYYRATIPNNAPVPDAFRPNLPSGQDTPSSTHASLENIESASASTIVDSSSKEILEELDRKSKTWQYAPFAIGATIALLLMGYIGKWPSWSLILLAVIGGVAAYVARRRDILAKTTVLFYELEPEAEVVFQDLHTASSAMASCSRIWHIEASGRVHNRKYHAGASDLIRRKSTSFRKAEMPFVKTNIETYALGVGKQTLYFFPDRVFVQDKSSVGAVSYTELFVSVAATRFIEADGVPSDSKVIGRTWRYTNKNGGPDRRFKDNRELPICEYEEVELNSATGLNELVQLSKTGAGETFANVVRMLAQLQAPVRNTGDTQTIATLVVR